MQSNRGTLQSSFFSFFFPCPFFVLNTRKKPRRHTIKRSKNSEPRTAGARKGGGAGGGGGGAGGGQGKVHVAALCSARCTLAEALLAEDDTGI